MGLKGPEAAKRAGMVYSTYMNHENGDRGGERHGEVYANAFRVNYLWLMTGKGPKRGPESGKSGEDLLADITKIVRQLEHLRSPKTKRKRG